MNCLSYILTLLVVISLNSMLCAQSSDVSDDSITHLGASKLEQLATIEVGDTGSTGNEETLKAIAEATAATQRNMLDRKESPLYKRALELQKRRATYLKEVAEGRARPFPNLVENWSHYESEVTRLSEQYEWFTRAEDPITKSRVAAPLLNALQPIGKVLQNARHGSFSLPKLTEEQRNEQEELMNAYNTLPSSDDEEAGGKLILTTPEVFYTLKHIPMPIQFSAPAGTEVILFSELGGSFSNNLSYIRLVTDEEGLASTNWMSPGDAVADCLIIYRSPEHEGKGRIVPIVKQLNLIPLEKLSPLIKAVTNKKPVLSK